MPRTLSFDEDLSRRLRSKEFAREYIFALMEEDEMSPVEALVHVIKKMGTKEFSAKSKIKAPQISRFLKNSESTKLSTLDQLLNPFGLQTDILFKKVS